MTLGGNCGPLRLRVEHFVELPEASNGDNHDDCKDNLHVAISLLARPNA